MSLKAVRLPSGEGARERLGALEDGASDDEIAGRKIVLRALEEPLRQIVANAGMDASIVLNKVVEGSGNFGFNALVNQYGDMVEMGVLGFWIPIRVWYQ